MFFSSAKSRQRQRVTAPSLLPRERSPARFTVPTRKERFTMKSTVIRTGSLGRRRLVSLTLILLKIPRASIHGTPPSGVIASFRAAVISTGARKVGGLFVGLCLGRMAV